MKIFKTQIKKILFTALLIFPMSILAKENQSNQTGIAINRCSAYLNQQNYQAAFKCYEPFAKLGESHAQFNIGMLYEKGLGTLQDYATAFRWYKKSGAQGFSAAQAKLGEMYAYGVGTTQDCSKGLYWIHKAADQNDIWALEDLTNFYKSGKCVKQDAKTASYWHNKWQSMETKRSQS